ncbi:hypothetical protein K1719_014048 [Acacia pycnantha]|nr:hypothetical protein K1719_014048 [Acacia pycnantha]
MAQPRSLSALPHCQWRSLCLSWCGRLRPYYQTVKDLLRDIFARLASPSKCSGTFICDYNSIFWIAHPGAAILDQVEVKLDLTQEETGVSTHVLSDVEASLKLKPEKMRATR